MAYQITSDICPSCNKKFTYNIVKMDNDIRHNIGCPYCDATVGWASDTDEVLTYKTEDNYF